MIPIFLLVMLISDASRGRGKEDHNAVVTILEGLAACKVAALDKDTS